MKIPEKMLTVNDLWTRAIMKNCLVEASLYRLTAGTLYDKKEQTKKV
jgi:hypothetical protein